MSSALPAIPNAARNIVKRDAPRAMRQIANLGMTPRQQDLNQLWSWYTCTRYDARKVDWDGSERCDPVDGEAIATAGVLPGGFYDAGADFPLKFRRPVAAYALPRVIVNRFTGLLFSESQHPRLCCTGDPNFEDYIGALAELARMWAQMAEARRFGGAQGSFCVTFKFIGGEPILEVHDPRWVEPTFKNLDTRELKQIEKRWMWPEYEMNDEGTFDEVWYWTRRIIDEEVDVIWNKVPVGNGDEPDWQSLQPDQAVRHDFGEFPGVWGQNEQVQDSIDGAPDCLGVYDVVEELDAIESTGGVSLKKNMDPTVVINSDLKLRELQKGSDNAVKLEKGGDAKYMEMTGAAVETAMKFCDRKRNQILEVTQCVLDNEDASSPAATATEVRMRYASMTQRADGFREQYGQRGVLPLIKKMVRAVRKLTAGRPGAAPDGGLLVMQVKLPPREITAPDGTTTFQERVLPAEDEVKGVLTLDWPPYFPPTLKDAIDAATAVKMARDSESLDEEHAARFLAPYFNIENVQAMLLKLKAERKEKEQEEEDKAKAAFAERGFGGGR